MLCTIPKKVLKKFEDVTPRIFPLLFRKTCFYAIWTDTQLWSEGSYELGFVHLAFRFSALPSFCPVVFLGLAHLFFLELSMVLRAHVVLCMTAGGFFLKNNIFAPKMGKMVFLIYWKI